MKKINPVPYAAASVQAKTIETISACHCYCLTTTAAWPIVLALLLFFSAGIALGQPGRSPSGETFRAVRYGKEVRLEKNNEIKITDLNVYYEKGAAYLAWKMEAAPQGGICVIMQSEDGVDYTYRYLVPSAKKGESHQYRLTPGNPRCFYQVLYISNDNRYAISERKYPAWYYAAGTF